MKGAPDRRPRGEGAAVGDQGERYAALDRPIKGLGLGKTHISVAPHQGGCSIYFTSLDDLVRQLSWPRPPAGLLEAADLPAASCFSPRRRRLTAPDPRLSPPALQLVPRRYERGADRADFNKARLSGGLVLPDEVLPAAILDWRTNVLLEDRILAQHRPTCHHPAAGHQHVRCYFNRLVR